MNLLEFANRMEKLADDLPTISNEILKGLTADLALALTIATPVDTSTALSNWQVGIGNPVSDFIDAHNFGEKGSTRQASAEQTYALALAAADKGLPGQSYWLSNNTPYIIDLNNGRSDQAPARFIQWTIAVTVPKSLKIITKQVFNDYRKR